MSESEEGYTPGPDLEDWCENPNERVAREGGSPVPFKLHFNLPGGIEYYWTQSWWEDGGATLQA